MSRFRNTATGVVVSVADSKDDRFGTAWESADEPKKAPAKKSASAKSEKK
jgi:hypothetical protein